MSRVTEVLSRLVFYFGAAVLIAMTLVVVLDVGLRAITGYSIGIVEEVVSYMLVAVTFFGVSLTFRERALFRVRFLFNALPAAIRKVLERIYLCFTIAFCTTMIWFSLSLVISSYVRGKISDTALQTPLYIPQILLPCGFFILLVFALEQLFGGEAGGE